MRSPRADRLTRDAKCFRAPAVATRSLMVLYKFGPGSASVKALPFLFFGDTRLDAEHHGELADRSGRRNFLSNRFAKKWKLSPCSERFRVLTIQAQDSAFLE